MAVKVHPATAARFDDVAAVLHPGKGDACWCLTYRLASAENSKTLGPARREAMRALTRGQPPPGMLAYVDGEPVGWCGFGPRTGMERLRRSRTIPQVDDSPVWSIVCFLIRPGFRRQGLTKVLLEGVIAYARKRGAVGLEAYPVDPGRTRIDTISAYVGTTDLFESAGFKRVTKTQSTTARKPRWLMRLDL